MRIPPGSLRPFNPLAGVFESDREFHEGQVARAIIVHLGWRVKSWALRPIRNANPDFVVVLEEHGRIGIETTEFLDQGMLNVHGTQRSTGSQFLHLASGMLRALRKRFDEQRPRDWAGLPG